MSFYGNVTNTSRTHFQFDRIYASRKEMESHKSSDGVYAGRYVLVEYDNQMHMDTFLRARKVEENGKDVFYSVVGNTVPEERLLTKGLVHPDTIIYTSAYEQNPIEKNFVKNCVFYKCTSAYSEGSIEPAEFMQIADEANRFTHIGLIDECLFAPETFYIRDGAGNYTMATNWSATQAYYICSNYFSNYSLDEKCYGRGYDSTVWQKVYVGGEEKYIMIAELNAIVPTFDLEVDAPTQAPVAPHFDLESSDLYYKLHYQPSWGLRVKSSKFQRGDSVDRLGRIVTDNDGNPIKVNYTTFPVGEEKSDENTTWTRNVYDPLTGTISTLYWHPVQGADSTGEWVGEMPQEDEVPAAIYYNKAGFDKETNVIDPISDNISLSPSGRSGQQYYSHNGSPAAAPDIQELSIILPSLGNSVAEMWNIIYGTGERQDDGQLHRNLDINWDSYEGLRMVNVKEDGNGYTYEPEQTSTLAGTINSVHDLMGMIIEENDGPINVNKADYDHIYYYNDNYYMKYITYQYTSINDQLVDRKIPEQMQYREIDWDNFDTFPANTYYYETGSETKAAYRLETKNYPDRGVTYKTAKTGNFFTKVIPLEYNPERCFKLNNNVSIGNNKYVGRGYLNGDEEPANNTEYCQLLTSPIETVLPGKKPYRAGVYYIYNGGQEIDPEVLEEESDNIASLLEVAQGNYNATYAYYIITLDINGNLTFVRQDVFDPTGYDNLYYTTVEENGSKYIKYDNNIPARALMDASVYFVFIEETDKTKEYYKINKYYNPTDTVIENGETLILEYTKCMDTIFDPSKEYYVRAERIEDVELDPQVYLREDYSGPKYYVGYTYYYRLQSGQYVLDTANTPYSNNAINYGKYYIKENFLYVISDPKGYFGEGAEWNSNIEYVPEEVVLGTRQPVPAMRQLQGFSKGLNTIHGLILQINQILDSNNGYTRDNTTVQGTINLLNDIIHKFEIVAAGQIMMVDEYGRVHSASIDGDAWVEPVVDTNAIEPHIQLNHLYSPEQAPALVTIDPNQDTDVNSFELETVKIDDKGHVVYKANTEVVLPVTFKQVTVNGDENTKVEADNCRDSFNINGDDILSVTTDGTSINFAHKDVEVESNIGSLDISDRVTTINTQIAEMDDSGHVVKETLITYNLSNIIDTLNNVDDKITTVHTNLNNIVSELTTSINTSFTTTQNNMNAQDSTLDDKIEILKNVMETMIANLKAINGKSGINITTYKYDNVFSNLPELDISDDSLSVTPPVVEDL